MLPAQLAHYPTQYDMSLLAIAVLDQRTFSTVYCNSTFLRLQKNHAMVAGTDMFRETNLREAAQRCWQQKIMVLTTLPDSLLRVEFSPLPGDDASAPYVQCLLLWPHIETGAGEQALQQPGDASLSSMPLAYARIIDHLPHSIWLCTPQGEIFWTNGTSNRYAYGTDEMLDASNTRYVSKVHPDDLTGAGIALSRAMNGDPPERPYRYRLRDHRGAFRWHEFCIAPVYDDNRQVLYWIGSSVNIEHTMAEARHLEAALSTANSQLSSLRSELDRHLQHSAVEQKMALVNHLAGGIAHDLNNLLQVVVACTEMALLADPSPAVESKLRLIADCVNRAGRMSSQLASFSGRQPQNSRVLDTHATLFECAQLLQRAVGAEIEFESRIADDLHPILADRSQLENTLINLAINARDAVNGHGRVLFDACNTTSLDSDGNPVEQVQLTLSDDGIGMDPALQEKGVRALLHHQTRWQGHRSGAVDGAALCPGQQWPHHPELRTGQGHQHQPAVATQPPTGSSGNRTGRYPGFIEAENPAGRRRRTGAPIHPPAPAPARLRCHPLVQHRPCLGIARWWHASGCDHLRHPYAGQENRP